MDAFLAQVVLWLAAAYLIALGITALVRPDKAQAFLAGFAQTRRANWIEAIIRFVIGLAFVFAAPALPYPVALTAFGALLMLTAAALPSFPDAHRRIAARSVASIAPFIRLVGVGSLIGGIVLCLLLSAALE